MNFRTILLLLSVLFVSTAFSSCKKWTLYKQCDATWGNAQLGTSSTETICSAGCAMSSVAMALATYGETINGQLANPGNLNSWLDGHNGYADSDLIVWASVDSLGTIKFKEEVTSLSTSTLGGFVSSCMPVIANVRSGTHWVLVTGQASNGAWYVNDPGFTQTTYDYSDMSEFVVYNVGTQSFSHFKAAHQSNPALISAAAVFGP